MEPFVLTEGENRPTLLLLERWMKRHPGLTAGFTTRDGGVSSGGMASLNCALHVNDRPEDVITNRRRLAEAVGLPFEAWTCGEQVHGSRVAVITREDAGRGRDRREDAVQAVDALITGEKGILLTSFYADCVPLYFYDPVRSAAGLAHAGWKGTVQGIAAVTVKAMHDAFGSRPEDMLAAIGPSIGLCCYEVDGQVIDQVAAMPELQLLLAASEAEHRWFRRQPNLKYKLNLQQINRELLIYAGILPTHIEITEWCTSCEPLLLYSHRRDHGMTGRMASWIAMN